MTLQNNKSTSKLNAAIIKTILFAGLIMTLVVPITTMNASAVIPDKIPDVNLIERSAEFSKQYRSVEEFAIRENAIKEYVTADLQPNGWNQFMVKENIRIHNFDTILGKVGYGHELVALFAAKDRLQGNYIATEPVTKFHDWLMSKYNTPTNVAEIDKRISEIVPDVYMHLAVEDVSSFNKMADKGNVPPELADQDPEYWIMIANVAVCQYDENCDHEGMRNGLGNKSTATNDMTSFVDLLSYFLPKVYAVTYKAHTDYVYANSNTCDYGTCWRSASGSGTNPVNLTISSGGGHGFGALSVYASTCSTVSGTTKSVAGSVDMGTVFYFSKQSTGNCAIQSQSYSLSNPNASYLWTVSTTHAAWI